MYMLIAYAEDGAEIRATDAEYATPEAAMRDIELAREHWPCLDIEPVWVNTRQDAEDKYNELYQNDTLDLY